MSVLVPLTLIGVACSARVDRYKGPADIKYTLCDRLGRPNCQLYHQLTSAMDDCIKSVITLALQHDTSKQNHRDSRSV